MKQGKTNKLFLFIILISLCLFSFAEEVVESILTSENTAPSDAVVSSENKTQKEVIKEEYKNPDFSSYLFAYGDMIFSNSAFHLFNRFVLKADWSQVTFDTIKYNLTHPWVFDQDNFPVNHFGHPYQGGLYYAGARANGLNFWNSSLVTLLGSVTWEYFCETERQSINDLFTTTLGGISTGEIFHRLYLEAGASTSPFAFLLSPVDALNDLITGKPQKPTQGNLKKLDFKISVGSLFSHIYFKEGEYSTQRYVFPITIGGGLDGVYGNSYGEEITHPFENFEFHILADWSKDYYSYSLFSEGFLYAFAPDFCNTERVFTSIGPSLHYDVIYNSNLNYTANSLGLSIKQHIDLSNDFYFNWQLHANAILIAGSDFYYLFVNGTTTETEDSGRIYDFCVGEGGKIFLAVGHPKYGKFTTSYIFNGLHTISRSIPIDGSTGYTVIGILGASYEKDISQKYGFGLSSTLYHKEGFYDSSPNLSQSALFGSVYFKINLL